MHSLPQPLIGLTILVTRPVELADNLAGLIKAAGGTPILYPVIEIIDTDKPAIRDTMLGKLAAYDLAIFISPSAVIKTFERIQQLPPKLNVVAIGSSTEKHLLSKGVRPSFQSEGNDSEALLKHAELQHDVIAGKSIVIFRGQGGRELLGNTLSERGAEVNYIEIYKRVPAKNRPPLTEAQIEKLDIVAVTSNEGLSNLVDLAENKSTLFSVPLLVPGDRSETLARQLGFSTIIKSRDATDIACIETLAAWNSRLSKRGPE